MTQRLEPEHWAVRGATQPKFRLRNKTAEPWCGAKAQGADRGVQLRVPLSTGFCSLTNLT